jgi:hypothetical protein
MLKYFYMGEYQQEELEGTQDFDTAEFLRHQTEIADRKKPLENLNRLYLRADYLESKGQFWGALLALQEALAVLPYTSIPVTDQDGLSAKFAMRINELTTRLEKVTEPWPGEPADPVKIEDLQPRPRPLYRLAARLGLTALNL